MAFDALRRKLEGEGLFDAAHKRPLPAMPRCIGVVTSKTGAALQDVIHVISRRWPLTRLLLAPVSVQGLEAESSIVAGIRALDLDPRPDVILITRGGGSKEDLWVFNSERIARAAYACSKPVVSAVGHEIDYTILDYVADRRAPTPSAAAEICVPDCGDLRRQIFILEQNIQKNIQSRYQICYNRYEAMAAGQILARQMGGMEKRAQRLEQLRDAIQAQIRWNYQAADAGLQKSAAVAASLNPYAVLSRGYSIVENRRGVAVDVGTLRPGDKITLRGSAACADCTVDAVKENDLENTQKL
ncbi:MAG: exodeoxyribonuclease VII large subunit [Gemmiger sp.]